jgi:hypothetical protein
MTADELTAIRRQMRADDDWTGDMLYEVMFRLTALEEILAARWPRSILVRRRLARAIRASVAEIDGSDFTGKRLNTIGTGWRDRIPPWDAWHRAQQ